MKRNEVDMTHGSLLPKILSFSFIIFITNMMQLLFNTSDLIIVGKFAGNDCLGAVGATTALLNVFIFLFMGFSVGVGVVCTHTYGSGDRKGFKETVDTAITLSLAAGVILSVLGFFLAGKLLGLMGTPKGLLPLSTLYMKIYFLAMPAMMFYNYLAAALRAVGNTKTPMLTLAIGGVINVGLNVFLVVVFKMKVDGVATASVVSQYISAILLFIHMKRADAIYKIEKVKFRIVKDKLSKILYIGIPNALYCTIISLSNVFIQSSLNSLGKAVVTGSSAASNIEAYVYQIQSAFHQSALVFTGQNFGAGKFDRIKRVQRICYISAFFATLVVGAGTYMIGKPLLHIFIKSGKGEAAAIAAGMDRLLMICVPYAICALIEIVTGVLNGLGQSIAPTVVSATGFCGVRIIWLLTVFQIYHNSFTLYLAYPVSWAISFAGLIVVYLFTKRKLFPKDYGKRIKTT